MIKEYLKKLAGKKILILMLVLGIVIMLIPADGKDNNPQGGITRENVNKIETDRLERIIKKIEGVRSCDVFVTYENQGENKFAYDVSAGTSKKMEVILTKDSPVIESVSTPEVRGVFVLLQGAGIDESEIAHIIKGATGVPLHRIYVKISKGE